MTTETTTKRWDELSADLEKNLAEQDRVCRVMDSCIMFGVPVTRLQTELEQLELDEEYLMTLMAEEIDKNGQ